MMPMRVAAQPQGPSGNSYGLQSRASNSSRAEDSGSGAEGPARKRFQANNSNGEGGARRTNPPTSSVKNFVEPRSTFASRRRSVRDQKAPLGPRSAEFTSRTDSLRRTHTATNTSSFAGPAEGERGSTEQLRDPNSAFRSEGGGSSTENTSHSLGSFDFEPSITFDDLHSNLTSRDTKSGLTSSTQGDDNRFDRTLEPSDNNGGVVDRPTPPGGAGGSRFGRAGSLLRRQSIASKVTQTPITSAGMEPPTTNLATRSKRQSQMPPSSIANPVSRPRKSIGPGVVDAADFAAKAPQRRRPSLATNTGLASLNTRDQIRPVASRQSVSGSANASSDGGPRFLTTSRSLKAKSMHVPSAKEGQDPNMLFTPALTPDHARSMSINQARSPGKSPGRGTNTPSSSAKRLSTMPAHVTGLGARTISPTDARRLKRMSTIQGPPPMPNTPPTPQPEFLDSRSATQSPSMIPRKSVTPSSSRTTPDHNRKSYSSGLSISSNTSHNSARNSIGPTLVQPRLPQSLSTSRLPTPKQSRNVQSAAGIEGEEVPPVPAIPKAFESPKEAGDQLCFPRKSSLPFDSSSINSASAGEPEYSSVKRREPSKVDRETRQRRGLTIASASDVEQKAKANPASSRKNLQPLRLPPLNVLPLSTPTVSRVAALQDFGGAQEDGSNISPRRGQITTPATPMTASRANFSTRFEYPDGADVTGSLVRSNSTSHVLRSDSAILPTPATSNAKTYNAPEGGTGRSMVSPYISSSLPKTNGEYYYSRPYTSGDSNPVNLNSESRAKRLNGPRAQTSAKTSKDETPISTSSPSEQETPSSASSLRRKLSISWKRSSSKASHAATERDAEYPPQPPKYDDMPPPKLPASANWNSSAATSPSPGAKASSHFERRRRKSSASSITTGAASTKSESIDAGRPTKRDNSDSNHATPTSSRSASSILGPMHKMLSSKSSSSTLRTRNVDTGLDRDDQAAEDEMRKLASKRKDFEAAAQEIDELRRRATPKECVTPLQAVRMVNLNIFEKGEIVDYKEIYFCGTKEAKKHVGDLNAQSANFGYDDERGDYNIVNGDHLAYRYEIVDLLGKGSFGQVVRCVDHKTGGLVAVKIIRNKKRFHQQALVEVNILQKLREWDPHNRHSMVNFTQSFYFRGHLCISTELLGINLYEFIKSNDFRGFSIKLIRRFTKQLLSSLVLLKSHHVIHCDLKPENVLLAHPVHSEIKVIDFGSSCFENEKVYTYIQSRFYRSPEVILGMTYGLPIDMWSIGCILAELYTGFPIFPGENEQEQLACIMEVFGPPEKHLIEKSTRKKLFFDSLGKPRLTVSSKGRRRRPSSKTLSQVLKCDDEAFLDFITRCLRWDPDRRLKPDEACHHEFVTGVKKTIRSRNIQEGVSNSPVKRNNAASQTPVSRPLPEPPTTSFRNGTAVKIRDLPSTSPSKVNPARRVSNINAVQSSIGVKRSSTGATIMNSSALPRVATLSGKNSSSKDLATAAAAISLRRDKA